LLPGFLLAGHESTSNLIGNAMRMLLEDRRHWDHLVTEPASTPAVVEEALRLEPSFQGMMRTTTRPTAIGEVELGADVRVLLLFGSANHDGTRFEEPESFKVERAPGPNLSFGRGIHFCIGATLARLEAQIALRELAARVPSLRLAPQFVPDYAPTLMLRGLTRLDVEWD
jgi:cytochrome P450